MMIPFMIKNCMASVQKKGRLDLGFQGAQMNWIDNDGLILLSNNSNFAFGFNPTKDVTLFLLVVIHKSSTTVVWSINRGALVSNSDNFVFDNTGNAFLQSGGSVIWSTDTAGKGVAAMELLDSGNLVLVGNDRRIIWQSFSNPTDTLLWNQEFSEGMKLVSNPNSNNLNYTLEVACGDMILSASFHQPHPYWAISKDSRNIINQNGGNVTKATIVTNSWNFYDKDETLLWYFVFSPNTDANATWVAVLGNDSFITFTILQNGGSSASSQILIPQDQCSRPAACDPYLICYSGNKCQFVRLPCSGVSASSSSSRVQALILSPTRELATQTEKVIQVIGEYINVQAHACVGGKSVGEDIRKLEHGIHVVSRTPGRVCDMLKRRSLRTRAIKLLIVDESDEMLSRGFKDQIYDVYRYLPPELQDPIVSSRWHGEVMHSYRWYDDQIEMSSVVAQHGLCSYAKEADTLVAKSNGSCCGSRLNLAWEMLSSSTNPMALGKLLCLNKVKTENSDTNTQLKSYLERRKTQSSLRSLCRFGVSPKTYLALEGDAFYKYFSTLSQISRCESVRLSQPIVEKKHLSVCLNP